MDRWITAQQIGIAAYCLPQFRDPHDRDDCEIALRAVVECYLAKTEGELIERVKTLPGSTLHLLDSVPALDDTCDVDGLAAAVTEAIRALFRDKEEPLGPKCNVLTHHILHGAANAKGIASLSEQLFAVPRKERIPIGSETMHRLDEILSKARSNDASTQYRVDFASEIASLLARDAVELAQIENALLHHIFCWPLLVSTRAHLTVAVSVPLAVEALFDEEDKQWREVARHIGDGAYVINGTKIDVNTPDATGRKFASYLADAVRVGRELWRKTHGHAGDWRNVIKAVPIIFDFGYADQVVDNVLDQFGLDEGSAGSYFVQIVLARLLGRDPYLSSAITGSIGRRVTYSDGKPDLDYYLETPTPGSPAARALPAKLDFVFKSQMFERLVIGKNPDLAISINLAHQTAEVLQAAKQSNVADIVQVLGWRRTHYVRCPEVAWTVHGPRFPDEVTPRGVLPPDSPGFRRVQTALAGNDQTIARLHGVSPRAVASYLWYLDRVVLEGLDPRPPALSWAFVRVTDYEQDSSFWQVLWRIAGAPEDELELLRYSPTTEAAIPSIRRLLNTFEPKQAAWSHRSPDVLVLIGAERLEESLRRLHNPAQRPLTVPAILEKLRTRGALIPCPYVRDYPRVAEWIGNTRIILLEDHGLADSDHGGKVELGQEDGRILELLCTFNWSFTQNTAALVLSQLDLDSTRIRGARVREVLEDLTERKLLRYILGEYFVPNRVRQAVEGVSRQEAYVNQARRHFAVGSALAPYWTASQYPALAYDAAFIPERVHEALHHLYESARLFSFARDEAGEAAARKAQRQVMRFGRLIGWGSAAGLIEGRNAQACKEVYLIIEEFMERWRTHPRATPALPNHPTHLVQAARALRYFEFRAIEMPAVSERYWGGALDKSAAIVDLFERGLDACRAFPFEEKYNRLFVLSAYSDYLETQGTKSRRRLEAVDNEIWRMQSFWPECPGAVRGEWFETQGDGQRDHKSAGSVYADGALCAASCHQLKVKGAGALCIAGLGHKLLDELYTLPARDNEESALRAIRGAKKAKDRDYFRKPRDQTRASFNKEKAHIIDRWIAGKRFITEAWKNYPRCAEMLKSF